MADGLLADAENILLPGITLRGWQIQTGDTWSPVDAAAILPMTTVPVTTRLGIGSRERRGFNLLRLPKDSRLRVRFWCREPVMLELHETGNIAATTINGVPIQAGDRIQLQTGLYHQELHLRWPDRIPPRVQTSQAVMPISSLLMPIGQDQQPWIDAVHSIRGLLASLRDDSGDTVPQAGAILERLRVLTAQPRNP